MNDYCHPKKLTQTFIALTLAFSISCCALSTAVAQEGNESGKKGSTQPGQSGLRSGANLAHELYKPVQIALISPIQVVDAESSVAGLRVNAIYGRNKDMVGADLGLVNHSTGRFDGLQVGGINIVKGDFAGVQAGVLFNSVDGSFVGFQGLGGGLGSVVEGNFHGWQNAFLNATTSGEFVGLQTGWISSLCDKDFHGLQTSGFFNFVKGQCFGVQFGLINMSESLNGVQIGLINIVKTGQIKFLPLLNASF